MSNSPGQSLSFRAALMDHLREKITGYLKTLETKQKDIVVPMISFTRLSVDRCPV